MVFDEEEVNSGVQMSMDSIPKHLQNHHHKNTGESADSTKAKRKRKNKVKSVSEDNVEFQEKPNNI